MNANELEPNWDGRPPKSVAEIRLLLKSIHDHSNPQPQGPYANGLSQAEVLSLRCTWHLVQASADQPIPARDFEYYCRMLLKKSAIAGGVSGGLLGANFGFTIAIVFGQIDLIVPSTLFNSSVGSAVGLLMARSCVLRRRVDLFNRDSGQDGLSCEN